MATATLPSVEPHKGASPDKTDSTYDDKMSEDKLEELATPRTLAPDRYRPQNPKEKALDRRVNLKLDLSLVLILAWGFMFSGIDKTNIGNAATSTFVKDAKLDPNDVGNATSLFAVTFVLLQPVTVIGSRLVGPRWWLGTAMLLWGAVTVAHAGINNRATLLALRLLLGALEAGWFPASMYYVSGFYPRLYIGARIAFCTTLFTTGSAFAGLIAYGILKEMVNHPLHNWQYLFIVEGAVTMGLAVILFIVVPSNPSTAWCLSQEERDHASHRLKVDLGASAEVDKHGLLHAHKKVTLEDWKSVVTDWPKVALMFCNIFIVLPVNGFGVFLPLILQGMGYKGVHANLMSVPPFLVGSVCAFFIIWLSDKVQKRGPFLIFGNCLAFVGLMVMVVSHSDKLRYGFTILCMIGAFTPGAIALAWLIVNTPEASKRSVVLGLNGWSNIASVIAGQLFRAKYKPSYKIPLAVTMGLQASATLGYAAVSLYWYSVNKKRDRLIANMTPEEIEAANAKPGSDSVTFKYTF